MDGLWYRDLVNLSSEELPSFSSLVDEVDWSPKGNHTEVSGPASLHLTTWSDCQVVKTGRRPPNKSLCLAVDAIVHLSSGSRSLAVGAPFAQTWFPAGGGFLLCTRGSNKNNIFVMCPFGFSPRTLSRAYFIVLVHRGLCDWNCWGWVVTCRPLQPASIPWWLAYKHRRSRCSQHLEHSPTR